jgi:hypothetical protein
MAHKRTEWFQLLRWQVSGVSFVITVENTIINQGWN